MCVKFNEHSIQINDDIASHNEFIDLKETKRSSIKEIVNSLSIDECEHESHTTT